ncbi:class I SAM-dependent methyltransferase [Nocardia macrotermitis]|uniref:Putative methyltransferase n=1 Tax=Nocardia macrotermitis TaxID=2585198 RepID=A0A7K0DEB0_9NOCA|nr:class I SAM-dependent methyltransferase [Nocardia macrotermitis]MQY23979.1 putative methyltransferase [Nocardia macrotermitis]
MTTADEWSADDTELRARRAASFGPEAIAYAEHRPDYPLAGIRWALEPLGAREPEVLDLAAGTGKLTAGLLAAGARVTAVEPDAAMLAEFRRGCREVTALSGTAEAIPLHDDSVDAVVVGQALHWFDQERAFPEIARVLRPGGVFAAFWNMHDVEVEWVAELDRLSRSTVSFQTRTSSGIVTHPLFEEFVRADFPHTQRRTVESLTATIGTHSHTLVISAGERAALLEKIATYLRGVPGLGAGEFDLPLRTLVIRSVLR